MPQFNPQKKISFILPSTGNVPIGGFKIVYEYANRLSERGHKVVLIHVHRKIRTSNLLKKAYIFFELNKLKLLNSFGPDNWITIHKNINSIIIPYLDNKYIPDADAIFATEYTTAKPVMTFDIQKGKKCYFIQSLETWLGNEEEVIETWKYPLKKIVISKWLKQYAENLGVEAEYIPNGLDFEKFSINNNPEDRDPFSILMLYHENEVKGSIFGLNALFKLKRKYNNLNVDLFSVYKKNRSIPDWINYYHLPSQEELSKLYNKASIFISPSLFEGFPLPPAESMMCGCALIATRIGGHMEYCIDNETALLVPVKDSESIFQKADYLLLNDNIRKQIARNGNLFIQRFTWEASIEKFSSFINEQVTV